VARSAFPKPSQVRVTLLPEPVTDATPFVVRRSVWLGARRRVEVGSNSTLEPLHPELCLRGLMKLEVADDEQVITFMDANGMVTKAFFDEASTGKRLPVDERHVDHARWWLAAARALVGHWEAHIFGEPLDEPWRAEGFVGVGPGLSAWTQFATYMNEGLRQYPTFVQIEAGDLVFGRNWSAGLYSGLCRQLAYHMNAEGPVLRRCAKQGCGQVFGSQQGRSLKGISRNDAIYCSAACAAAEKQRQYRIRQRAKEER